MAISGSTPSHPVTPPKHSRVSLFSDLENASQGSRSPSPLAARSLFSNRVPHSGYPQTAMYSAASCLRPLRHVSFASPAFADGLSNADRPPEGASLPPPRHVSFAGSDLMPPNPFSNAGYFPRSATARALVIPGLPDPESHSSRLPWALTADKVRGVCQTLAPFAVVSSATTCGTALGMPQHAQSFSPPSPLFSSTNFCAQEEQWEGSYSRSCATPSPTSTDPESPRGGPYAGDWQTPKKGSRFLTNSCSVLDTPAHVRYSVPTKKAEKRQRLEDIAEQLINQGTVTLDTEYGQQVTLFLDRNAGENGYLGAGEYYTAYKVLWNGQECVLKIPRLERADPENEQEQYVQLCNGILDFYVPEHYFAGLPDGLMLVQFIGGSEGRDVDWTNPVLCENLKQLIQYAYEENLPLDLHRENVKVINGNQIVVIDPMHPQNDPFRLTVSQCLKSFLQGVLEPEASALRRYLDPRPGADALPDMSFSDSEEEGFCLSSRSRGD